MDNSTDRNINRPLTNRQNTTLRALALCAALLVLLGHVWYLRSISGWLVDDALISFRYAENFAAGKGLVFNEGEYVEGYTNFLWTLTLGAGAFFRIPLETLALVLGIICTLLTAVFTHLLFRKTAGAEWRGPLKYLPVYGLALSMPVALWAFGSLETPMFSMFLVLAALLYVSKRYAFAGMALGLLALTRPEGVMVFAVTIAHRALCDRGIRRSLAVLAGVFACFFIPHEFFRIVYYGDIVPNTFHAKVGFHVAQLGRGLGYLKGFFIATGALAFILPFGAPANYRDPKKSYLLMLVGTYLVYIIYTGGDPLPAYRFFVPLEGLFFVMLGNLLLDARRAWRMREEETRDSFLLDENRPASGQWAWLLAVGLLLFFVLGPHVRHTFIGGIHDHVIGDKVVERGRIVGAYLKRIGRPGETVATNSAGSIPYYSGLRAIDMLGLTDAHIASVKVHGLGTGFVGHEKYDAEYVLARMPEYIVFGSAACTNPVFPGDKIINRHYIRRVLYKKQHAREDAYSFSVLILSDKDLKRSYLKFIRTALEHGDVPLARAAASYAMQTAPDDPEMLEACAEVGKWKETGRCFDFEDGSYSGFTIEGEAFGSRPAAGKIGHQVAVIGFMGNYLANSFFNSSDNYTGKLVSEPFELCGDVLSFRIGGGLHTGQLTLALIVEGKEKFSATGNGSEILEVRSFDIRKLRGRSAHVEIADNRGGSWGHILVDDIVQYKRE
jgi:hypothetical protein